jgi:putative transposase
MSRIARIVLEGVAYHVTQRGNARQQVFFEDRDYLLYQDLLRTSCAAAGLRIWAYCLMPNHVHLVAIPERAHVLAKAMGRAHADYARYYNLRNRTCGHVWQARYYSAPLDEAHLWQALAYVERNPVRARLVERAEAWAWSSAGARQSGDSGGMLELAAWQEKYDWPRWTAVLETSVEEEAFGQRLQEASRRGRPLGADEFVDQLESRSGRRLRAKPVGRPKQLKATEGVQMALGYRV